MAARFVIGLAGTGKTSHCANALAQASLADPLGPPLLWLVPQQATFMSEQRLLASPGLPGTFRAQVLGFDRLCHILAPELGLESAADLSGITRMLMLAQAVDQSQSQLVLFGQVARQPGFLAGLDAILRELQRAGHDTSSLDQVRRTLASRGPADDILNRKLQDFITLLTAWQNRLGANQYDPDRLPQLVADRLSESTRMAASRVWLDSFSVFSAVEINLVTAMAKSWSSMDITILADPASAVFQSADAPPHPLSTFHRTEVMYRRLLGAFEKARVAVEPPLFLTQPHRFAHTPDLVRVAQELFWQRAEVAAAAAPAFATPITIWECDTPESEIRAAAELIHELTADKRLRYRDIGIVVADIDAYEPAIRRIFAAHDIPNFIDRRRPITHHPLVELLRTAVNLVKDHYRQADWLALLKTGLTDMTEAETFILENYLMTRGIDHDDFSHDWHWAAPDQDENAALVAPEPADLAVLEQANAIRRKVYQNLAAWLAAAPAETVPALKIRALRELLARLHVRTTLQTWIDHAADHGQPELTLIHEQAWREVLNLLEVMEKLSATVTGTLADFSALLDAGLETLTLGLIPPALDQVLVSSANRSRHPELHTVIILGSVETRFPQVLPEDPMLDDRQREMFNLAGGAPIGGGSRQDLLEARFFDYVAFTRAARQLIISYPAVDGGGTPVTPSRYVQALRQAVPAVPVRQINAGNNDIRRWACRDDVLAGFMRWLRASAAPPTRLAASPTSMTAPQALALYHWLTTQADQTTRAAAHQAFAALKNRNRPRLSSSAAHGLHSGELRMSAIQLESFCRCPQQYFFAHTLRLGQRRTPDMDALALGLVYHQALQGVFARIIAGDLAWPGCSRESLLALLESQIEAAFAAVETRMFAQSPQSRALRQPVRRNLRALVTKEHLAAQSSQLRPRRVEASFGLIAPDSPDAGAVFMPPLKFTGPGGIAIAISGKIDRVDASDDGWAIVVDYKSGKDKFNLTRARAGISLQLLLYLLVLSQPESGFEGQPYRGFGAFYQPVKFAPKTKAFSGSLPEDDPTLYESLKPSGFFLLDQFPMLEPMPQRGQAAKWFNLKIKKDGTPYEKPKDPIAEAELQEYLRSAQHLITTVADLIATGCIEPEPFRDGKTTACTHCDFQPACPFDRLVGRYHNIKQQPGPPGQRVSIGSQINSDWKGGHL